MDIEKKIDIGPGKRLKEFRKERNLTQEELAITLGVKAPTISRIENGNRTFTEQMGKSISLSYGVSLLWLMHGEGNKYNDPDEEVMTVIDDIMTGETTFTKNLIKAIVKTPKNDLMALKRIIDIFKEIEGQHN